MLPEEPQYHILRVSHVDSPALLVFPDIVSENIDNTLGMLSQTGSTFLRPHVKTVKCQEVIQMAIKKGIDRFKCSTIAEAELLGMAGAKDVLLSYQLSEAKARRFADLRTTFPQTRFSSLIDNIKSAQMLSDIFKADSVDVFIDLNVGMDRTGIKPDKTIQLIQEVKYLKNLHIKGLHAYDGHVHDPDKEVRKKQATAIFESVSILRKEAEDFLDTKLALVIGGSPSFPFYANKQDVECSPGTIFFWDAGYGTSFPELPFTPAALILTRIISIIDDKTLCFDLGTKATASDPPQPRVDILNLEDHQIIGQYEEHLVVGVPDTSPYKVGEAFLAIPYHICPTVNLYEELTVIENGAVSGIWKVLARDRKITI